MNFWLISRIIWRSLSCWSLIRLGSWWRCRGFLALARRLANGSMIARSFHLFDAGGDHPPLLTLSSLELFFQGRKN